MKVSKKIIMMTQDERWQQNYDEVMQFVKTNRRNLSKYEIIETNHRNLSKYDLEERRLYTWMKHNRKAMNAGVLRPERVAAFKELLALCEQYKRVNQYE